MLKPKILNKFIRMLTTWFLMIYQHALFCHNYTVLINLLINFINFLSTITMHLNIHLSVRTTQVRFLRAESTKG